MNQDRLLREYALGTGVMLLTWRVAPLVVTFVLWVELVAWRLARGWG